MMTNRYLPEEIFHPRLARMGNGELRMTPSESARSFIPLSSSSHRPAHDGRTAARNARERVEIFGGPEAVRNTSNVLSQHLVQFGRYRGQTFKWLFENDLGWVITLLANAEDSEEEMDMSNPMSTNKFLLLQFLKLFPEAHQVMLRWREEWIPNQQPHGEQRVGTSTETASPSPLKGASGNTGRVERVPNIEVLLEDVECSEWQSVIEEDDPFSDEDGYEDLITETYDDYYDYNYDEENYDNVENYVGEDDYTDWTGHNNDNPTAEHDNEEYDDYLNYEEDDNDDVIYIDEDDNVSYNEDDNGDIPNDENGGVKYVEDDSNDDFDTEDYNDHDCDVSEDDIDGIGPGGVFYDPTIPDSLSITDVLEGSTGKSAATAIEQQSDTCNTQSPPNSCESRKGAAGHSPALSTVPLGPAVPQESHPPPLDLFPQTEHEESQSREDKVNDLVEFLIQLSECSSLRQAKEDQLIHLWHCLNPEDQRTSPEVGRRFSYPDANSYMEGLMKRLMEVHNIPKCPYDTTVTQLHYMLAFYGRVRKLVMRNTRVTSQCGIQLLPINLDTLMVWESGRFYIELWAHNHCTIQAVNCARTTRSIRTRATSCEATSTAPAQGHHPKTSTAGQSKISDQHSSSFQNFSALRRNSSKSVPVKAILVTPPHVQKMLSDTNQTSLLSSKRVHRSTACRNKVKQQKERGERKREYTPRQRPNLCKQCKEPKTGPNHRQYFGNWFCRSTATEEEEEWERRMKSRGYSSRKNRILPTARGIYSQ